MGDLLLGSLSLCFTYRIDAHATRIICDKDFHSPLVIYGHSIFCFLLVQTLYFSENYLLTLLPFQSSYLRAILTVATPSQ